MTRIKREFALLLTVLIWLLCHPVLPQDPENSDFYPVKEIIPGSSGLFDSEDILEISLRFDIAYFKKKKTSEEYLDAILTFHYNENDSVNRNIRLQARGERRNELCSFPPIRLNIEDSDLGYNDIEKVKNIKLVTHCNPSDIYEDYLFMEYLVYKLFRIVTDTSFRVRLMQINYVDTGKRGKNETRYGFMIEPARMVANRLDGVEIEDIVIREHYIDQQCLDIVSMFQYMIGNTDWYIPNLHNLKVFRINNYSLSNVVIIPYDFDYSGIINTYYAVPHEEQPIETVLERMYLGPERSDEQLNDIIERFRKYKDTFILTINQFEYLDQRYKTNMVRYIESFYKDLEDETLLKKIKFDINVR